jgi:diaminopimelate epimerase
LNTQLEYMSACGNRFAVADGFRAPLPPDPAGVARALAAGVDGLLLVRPIERRRESDAAMEVYNRDGTRPQACGNGLRCVAVVLARHGLGHTLRVATDAGARSLSVLSEGPDWRVRAGMGSVRELRDALVATSLGELCATIVDVGNPHAVVLCDDVARAPLDTLGPELQGHALFPAGVNVEFAAPNGTGHVVARVFERGVGETAACGTGALACALAAERARRVELPCEVVLPGGSLWVSRSEGELFVEGPVEAALHAAS